MLTEFGADTVAGLHANPPVMWSEEYQSDLIAGYLEIAARKEYMCGMQIWNFADFAAVQGVARVGGMNLKGVFTRARQPKMAAHTLREWWVNKAAAGRGVGASEGRKRRRLRSHPCADRGCRRRLRRRLQILNSHRHNIVGA